MSEIKRTAKENLSIVRAVSDEIVSDYGKEPVFIARVTMNPIHINLFYSLAFLGLVGSGFWFFTTIVIYFWGNDNKANKSRFYPPETVVETYAETLTELSEFAATLSKPGQKELKSFIMWLDKLPTNRISLDSIPDRFSKPEEMLQYLCFKKLIRKAGDQHWSK